MIKFLVFHLIIYTAHAKRKTPLVFDSAYGIVLLLKVVWASLLEHLGVSVGSASLWTRKLVTFKEPPELLSALLLNANILFLLVTVLIFVELRVLIHYGKLLATQRITNILKQFHGNLRLTLLKIVDLLIFIKVDRLTLRKLLLRAIDREATLLPLTILSLFDTIPVHRCLILDLLAITLLPNKRALVLIFNLRTSIIISYPQYRTCFLCQPGVGQPLNSLQFL